MKENEPEHFYASTSKEWRDWLQKNHQKKQSVWLIQYKIKSGKPTLSWSHAVDEALCFGWIDSIRKTIDDESYKQLFSKRKKNSVWSKVNKEKVKQLVDSERMTAAGFASVDMAKQNGSWTILDEVEELIIPNDLEKEFKSNRGSKRFFLSLSKSVRNAMLQWLVLAKQKETRQKRVNEIATLASVQLKPKQFR